MESIIRKVSKVATLAARPGTEDEGLAAARILIALCARLGEQHGHGVTVQVALDGALRGVPTWLYGAANEAYYEGL